MLALMGVLFAGQLTGCGGGGSNEQPKVDNGGQADNSGGQVDSGDNNTTTPPPTNPGDENKEQLTAEQGYEKLTANLVDGVVIPLYQNVEKTNLALKAQVTAFCSKSEPSLQDLADLQEKWRATSASWQQARSVKMGPIADTFHYSRIQYWPYLADRLISDVEVLFEQNTDMSQGVASLKHQLQGLPAFEYVIFNKDKPLLTSADRAQRCQFISAITDNIDTLVTNSVTQWQTSYGEQFRAGNGIFTDKKQALEKFLTVWFEYLEIIRDDKVNKPLGLEVPGKIELAESIFSESSVANIKENIVALEKLYEGSGGFGFDDYLIRVNQREDVTKEIKLHFQAVYQAIDTTGYLPMGELVSSNEGRVKLANLATAISNLRSLMSSDFVQVTELSPGFNTNDGD
jgi:predicted lipoprotein